MTHFRLSVGLPIPDDSFLQESFSYPIHFQDVLALLVEALFDFAQFLVELLFTLLGHGHGDVFDGFANLSQDWLEVTNHALEPVDAPRKRLAFCVTSGPLI